MVDTMEVTKVTVGQLDVVELVDEVVVNGGTGDRTRQSRRPVNPVSCELSCCLCSLYDDQSCKFDSQSARLQSFSKILQVILINTAKVVEVTVVPM